MSGLAVRIASDDDLDDLARMNKELIEDEEHDHDNPMNVAELMQRMYGFIHSSYKAFIFVVEDRTVVQMVPVELLRDYGFSERLTDLVWKGFLDTGSYMGPVSAIGL